LLTENIADEENSNDSKTSSQAEGFPTMINEADNID